ncbi:hypothetical protein CLOM_g15914 [Closterium sp. NIES-68]|nr:hypothetical protein CLOM_g15914 [Closterium sp. NIES-68]GJP84901.1 hypothetical protein CLOP_g14947 [Closterium sp. NIES-67]
MLAFSPSACPKQILSQVLFRPALLFLSPSRHLWLQVLSFPFLSLFCQLSSFALLPSHTVSVLFLLASGLGLPLWLPVR